MPKREALSTRSKVQTSNGVCSEGANPLQAVMKNLITFAIGPKMQKPPPCHFIFLSLGHHVCVLQAAPAPARLDLVWTEVVHAAAAVQLLVLAQAQVRGRDVVIAAPQRPRGDALTHGL